MRDWHGRCLSKDNFSSDTGQSAEELQGIGATIIFHKPNNNSNPNSLNVREAFLFSCPLLKSHSYPPYAIDRPHEHNYVAKPIQSLIRDVFNDSRLTDQQEATETFIIDFVQKIKELNKL